MGNKILMKFKLIKAFIVVLLICNNEYDLIKIESTRVNDHNISPIISLWGLFKKLKGSLNPTVQGLIRLNLEPIQAFMVDLVTCKNEEDPIKNEDPKVVTTLFNYF